MQRGVVRDHQAELDRQVKVRTAELEEKFSALEKEACKLRRQKLELEGQLTEREKVWKAERERLTSGVVDYQVERDARIEALSAKCVQLEALSAKCVQLEARNRQLGGGELAASANLLQLAHRRVRVLEKQVSELEAARGAQTGPSPYSVLYDMAKCMNQMGKEVEKVKLFLRCGVAALLNPIRRPCRSTNRGGRSRTT